MYFLRRLRPFEVAGERVRSLRVSLNAPVLTAPDLPAGPARAVIVVHREARGRMDATVGVRSVASGEIAYWSFDGDLESEADVSVAADAALTFAESLGFLFDEAPLGGGAAADKAFRAWSAGEESGVASPRVSRARGEGSGSGASSADPPELELADLVVEELPATPPRESPAAPAAPAAPASKAAETAGAQKKTLSKFRARDAAPAAGPATTARKTPARQPLARVQLVKRRSPEDERKLVIRKLLTSF
jgi:hypothetical protein